MAKELTTQEIYRVAMVARIGPKNLRRRAYLREWRKFRGLTQEELAARIGTTGASISRYENGTRPYPGGFLAAVAEALDCQEGDLFRRPEERSLDALLADAPPELRRRVLQAIEILIKDAS